MAFISLQSSVLSGRKLFSEINICTYLAPEFSFVTLFYLQDTVLWRIDWFLGKNLEINNETTAVTMQRRGNHASTTIELLFETVFSAWSMPRRYLEDNWSDLVSNDLRLSRL
jgi:hypothetical protein